MKIVPPPRGQIAERGERIYREQLRCVLEPAHTGDIAVINVETGEYEVGTDHVTVSKRAAARWPGRLLYAVRVGAETLGHIGARFRAKAE